MVSEVRLGDEGGTEASHMRCRCIYLWLSLLRRVWRESLHWVPDTGTRWWSANTQDTQCSQHIIQSDHFKRSRSDSWFPQGNLHDRRLLPTSLNSILPLFCSFTLLPPYCPPLSSSRCCNPCCKQPHYFPPKVLNFPSPFLLPWLRYKMDPSLFILHSLPPIHLASQSLHDLKLHFKFLLFSSCLPNLNLNFMMEEIFSFLFTSINQS